MTAPRRSAEPHLVPAMKVTPGRRRRPPEIASHRIGAGEPVLLLHGIGTSHVDFTEVATTLSDSFDVIAVDLPGHGASPPLAGHPTVAAIADAIERHLDELGLGDVHVVGNSLGGRVAIELATRGRARSVVAISPSGSSTPLERMVQTTALAASGAGLGLLRRIAPDITAHALGRTAVASGMRALPWRATRPEADEILHGFGTRPYWSTLWWATAVDVPVHLDRIRCPVQLVQGAHDTLAGLQLVRFAVAIPHARVSIVPFAGHAAQGDRPAAIARIVREVIGRCRRDAQEVAA